jgi:hypothetical protein
MIARPTDIPDGTPAFARAVLAAAAEVEAAENSIKLAILDAAKSGDCARVIDIVTRWTKGPATEVLAHACGGQQKERESARNGLEACGGVEVTQEAPSATTGRE